MAVNATAQNEWTEVTESDIPHDWHPQIAQCFQSEDDGRLLAIERGTAHGSRFSINILNAPFWEDSFVLENVADVDSIDEAEEIAQGYMQENN